jgi:hypothetical protein
MRKIAVALACLGILTAGNALAAQLDGGTDSCVTVDSSGAVRRTCLSK